MHGQTTLIILMLALECQLLLEGKLKNSETNCWVQRTGISYIKEGIFKFILLQSTAQRYNNTNNNNVY